MLAALLSYGEQHTSLHTQVDVTQDTHLSHPRMSHNAVCGNMTAAPAGLSCVLLTTDHHTLLPGRQYLRPFDTRVCACQCV